MHERTPEPVVARGAFTAELDPPDRVSGTPATRGGRRARRIGWIAVVVLSTAVVGYAGMLIASAFRLVPDVVAANRFPSALGLRIHIVGASLAMLVGPWQFVRPLRRRWPRVHRVLGWTYVIAVFVGSLAGGAIALFSASGLVAGVGFFCLAIASLLTTGVAFGAALRGDYLQHQRWMLRSFALLFSGVMLRVLQALAASVGIAFSDSYPVVAWLCWVPNLVVVQLLVRRARGAADF